MKAQNELKVESSDLNKTLPSGVPQDAQLTLKTPQRKDPSATGEFTTGLKKPGKISLGLHNRKISKGNSANSTSKPNSRTSNKTETPPAAPTININ